MAIPQLYLQLGNVATSFVVAASEKMLMEIEKEYSIMFIESTKMLHFKQKYF